MKKGYSDYMDEISADELYEGLLAHGLFSDKLPPVFTSEYFYRYSLSLCHPFSKGNHGFIFFNSMRDINIPRSLGIPNPMAYQRLCACLKENWDEIKTHFQKQTDGNDHKISRIHIRKKANTRKLFEMNYKNWKTDDSPTPDIMIGKKYVVSADISTCFPSMYTHSLCWALVGKDYSKEHREESCWFNVLDHRCMEIRSGETHGFLIGPHASNLLSEIILTAVDRQLYNNGWKYIRNIDDYICYVKTYEEAQRFLTDLSAQLRVFDLPLNHKKTKIEKMPIPLIKQWVHRLNSFDFSTSYGPANYKKAQAYLDLAIELMGENGNNAAILNYAIKVLSKQALTENARNYCLKMILHFAIIYPYIIPLLDEYVFDPLLAQKEQIKRFSNIAFATSLENDNYEGAIYSIYFSIKYNFDILQLNADSVIKKDSCLLCVFAWMYYRNREDKESLNKLKRHAYMLSKNNPDEYWLFIYEALPYEQLNGDFKPMKKAKISFIKKEYCKY